VEKFGAGSRTERVEASPKPALQLGPASVLGGDLVEAFFWMISVTRRSPLSHCLDDVAHVRLGGSPAMLGPTRGTHAARIAVVIHVAHAATWAAMEFLYAVQHVSARVPTMSLMIRTPWSRSELDPRRSPGF
jgi:hypothetical protein